MTISNDKDNIVNTDAAMAFATKGANDLKTSEGKKGTGISYCLAALLTAHRYDIDAGLTKAIDNLFQDHTTDKGKALAQSSKTLIGVRLFNMGIVVDKDNGPDKATTQKHEFGTTAKGVEEKRQYQAIWAKVNASAPVLFGILKQAKVHGHDKAWELSKKGYIGFRADCVCDDSSLDTDLSEHMKAQTKAGLIHPSTPGYKAMVKNYHPTSMDNAYGMAKKTHGMTRGGSTNTRTPSAGQSVLGAAETMLSTCDPTERKLSKENEADARSILAHLLRYYSAQDTKTGAIDSDKLQAIVKAGAA